MPRWQKTSHHTPVSLQSQKSLLCVKMWLEAWGKIGIQTATRRLSLQGGGLEVDMTILHLPWRCNLFTSGLLSVVSSFFMFSISEGLGLVRPVPCWDLQCKAGIERRWRQETLQRNQAGRKCQLHQHFFLSYQTQYPDHNRSHTLWQAGSPVRLVLING